MHARTPSHTLEHRTHASFYPDLSQVWVYGNSFESSLVAVVVPNPDNVKALAQRLGVSGDIATLCKDPKVVKGVLDSMSATAKVHFRFLTPSLPLASRHFFIARCLGYVSPAFARRLSRVLLSSPMLPASMNRAHAWFPTHPFAQSTHPRSPFFSITG